MRRHELTVRDVAPQAMCVTRGRLASPDTGFLLYMQPPDIFLPRAVASLSGGVRNATILFRFSEPLSRFVRLSIEARNVVPCGRVRPRENAA
jgi:hypothetical protein